MSDMLDENLLGKIASGSDGNAFVLSSKDYASDQVVRIMASLMFHATVGKEFKDAITTMGYILKHPKKF